MDRIVREFDAIENRDLMLCLSHGVAWQKDMTHRVAYDAAYFNKCAAYEDQTIARALNGARIALVDKHVGANTQVLDIGIGSGEFIRKRPNTRGFDINPAALQWLRKHRLYSAEFAGFWAFTFWDVLEHVEDPEVYFRHMTAGSWVFASLPIFNDMTRIRESKHYRPGEHLYYWTESGFVNWMREHGFDLADCNDYETQAGRESIVSFAFHRCL